MSFNNHHNVQSQVGHQIIHGDLIHHHHHHPDDVTARKRRRLQVTDKDPQSDLDGRIRKSLAFPEMTQRRRNIENPYGQTCEWIFRTDEYLQWTAQRSGLLWIRGKPGTGKSTLMSHIYNDLQSRLQHTLENELCLEYFFTARGVFLERSALGLFRSLLNQILCLDPATCKPVRGVFQNHLKSFNNAEWQWQQAELQALFTDAVIAAAQRRRVVIFIDALDEAGARAAEEIARYFHTLNDKASEQLAELGICIACRYYPVPPIRRQALEIHVEEYNYEAIGVYIRGYIDDYMHDLFDGESQETLSRKLCEMANGVFQWVCLVLPLLRTRIVDGGSLQQAHYWLSQLSTDLDRVYEYIITQVIEDKAIALRLFQWVCLALRPLSVIELRYAIAAHDLVDGNFFSEWDRCQNFVQSDTNMQKCIRAWSGGLIEFKSSERSDKLLAQPIHLSVRSYIQKRGLDLLTQTTTAHDDGHRPSHIITAPELIDSVAFGHGRLYWCCLHYLAFEKETVSSLCRNLEKKGILYSYEPILEKCPLLLYAAQNAISHARIAQRHRMQNLNLEQQLMLNAILTMSFLNEYFEAFVRDTLRMDVENFLNHQRYSTPLHVAAAAGLNDLAQYLLLHDSQFSMPNTDEETALHIAALYGSLDLVQTLVNAGADVDVYTKYGKTPLMYAASRRHETVFAWLLQQGASLVVSREGHETALYVAASSGSFTIVKLCVNAGADVNAQGGRYGNALQAAASLEGSVETVKFLLEAGADVNIQGGEYGSALQAAASSREGSLEKSQLLLEAGVDVNVQGGQYGNPLQAAASWKGSVETVKLLLEAGADVNARGGDFISALQAALVPHNDSVEKVQLLLEVGADVNARGGHYGNPLSKASSVVEGSIETVKLLLEAGADINAQGGEYGHALQGAAYSGLMKTVKLLLEAGADVNARGGEYDSAIQAACASYMDSLEKVRLLLEAGANANAQGGRYGNALQAAASPEGSVETVKFLLEAGADVNAQGGQYGSALQAAASSREGSLEKSQLLLEAGADVNVQGGHYGNALQAAASWNGSVETVKLLLEAGADVNARGGEYGSALQAASQMCSIERVKLLLEAGADVNAQGGAYGSAFIAASRVFGGDSIKQMKLLLEAGADINAQGGGYISALQVAASRGLIKTVKFLLEAGADVNAQGGCYGNALQAAASWNGSAETVKLLLEAGADVNARGGEYGSALQAASVSREGSLEKAQLLLKAGADVNVQGGRYGNALQAAASRNGSVETVKLLLEAGADVNAWGGEYGSALRAARFQCSYKKVDVLLEAGARDLYWVTTSGGSI